MYVLVLYDPNKVLFNFFKISRNLVKCVNLSGVNLSGTTVYIICLSTRSNPELDGTGRNSLEKNSEPVNHPSLDSS